MRIYRKLKYRSLLWFSALIARRLLPYGHRPPKPVYIEVCCRNGVCCDDDDDFDDDCDCCPPDEGDDPVPAV